MVQFAYLPPVLHGSSPEDMRPGHARSVAEDRCLDTATVSVGQDVVSPDSFLDDAERAAPCSAGTDNRFLRGGSPPSDYSLHRRKTRFLPTLQLGSYSLGCC